MDERLHKSNIMRTEEDRMHEFIGDAVYELLARELLMNNITTRHTNMQVVIKIRSNLFMASVAKSIGLEPVGTSDKRYANALEIHVYKIYKNVGIEAAKTWFKDTVLEYYYNH
jgi:hypothetical protein